MSGLIEGPADLSLVCSNYINCLTSIKRNARAQNFHDAYRSLLDFQRDIAEDIFKMKDYLISRGALR